MDPQSPSVQRESGPRAMAESVAHGWELEARRYQEVHDHSPDGMMIFRALRDDRGAIVDFEWLYSNSSASAIVGRRPEDLLGKRLLVEMPGNKASGLFDVYVKVVELGQPYAHEFAYRHEGLDSWFRSTSIKLGDGFYVAFSDLTIRKRAEENGARLAAIIRSTDHAIYSTSSAGTLETWNHGAEKLYGYTSAEILGRSVLLIVPEPRRQEREKALERIFDRGGVESFQTLRLTKTARLVHVSVTLSAIGDADGKTVGIAVIARDISEQVELQRRLVAADRMVSVGTLAAGMAHEINNPLAYVTANLDIVIEELRVMGGGSPTGRLRELEGLAVEARGGADRIRKIVRGLMTFSRGEEERREVVDVKPVLDLAIAAAFNEIRHRARMTKDYGEIPLVLADDARLTQVFINLLVNAAQAIGSGNPEANEIRVSTSTDAAGRAVIEVRDTGPGIPAAIMDRLFDPFFTTKPVGLGTGLGLSICHNIVTGMGGEITATNHEGHGTTFRVVLPASLRPPEMQQPGSLPKAVKGGAVAARRGTVLIVDDEPAVGIVLGRVLRDHDVTVVTKAADALDLLLSGKHFDVILSDLMMPEMSGIDLYDELTRRFPDAAQRVVFISGGACTPAASAFLERVTNERMEKPFDTKNIRSLVQRFVKP
jgi:PAS domain S-box-containing protein